MLAFLLVLFAQAAPQKGLTLRDLQERARKNDPRAMQALAQLENAQGKHEEASTLATESSSPLNTRILPVRTLVALRKILTVHRRRSLSKSITSSRIALSGL